MLFLLITHTHIRIHFYRRHYCCFIHQSFRLISIITLSAPLHSCLLFYILPCEITFHLPKRTLIIFFSARLLVIISIFWKVLYLYSFVKKIITRQRISLSSGFHFFFREVNFFYNSLIVPIFEELCLNYFFLFIFCFQQFYSGTPWNGLMVFPLFEAHRISWLCGLMLLIYLDNYCISHFVFKYFFWAISYFPSAIPVTYLLYTLKRHPIYFLLFLITFILFFLYSLLWIYSSYLNFSSRIYSVAVANGRKKTFLIQSFHFSV